MNAFNKMPQNEAIKFIRDIVTSSVNQKRKFGYN